MMNEATKKEVFALYSEKLKAAINDSLFTSLYFQQPHTMGRDLSLALGLRLTTGATRGCLISPDCDWVVKFDIEGDEVHDSICDFEQEVYCEANEQDLSRYLCETQYIGMFRYKCEGYDFNDAMDALEADPDIYFEDQSYLTADEERLIRKRCEPTTIYYHISFFAYRKAHEWAARGFSKQQLSEASSYQSPLNARSAAVAAAFIEYYGIDEFDRFSEFLDKMGVNDLHVGNCGIVDDNFVLIDYGGFIDDDEYAHDLSSSDVVCDVSIKWM